MKIWIRWSKQQHMLCKLPSHLTHHILHAFWHDIIFCHQLLIDWNCLKQLCQTEAEKNNAKENKKSQEHTHHVGDLVLLLIPTQEWCTKCNLQSPTEGPNPITDIFTNGTISIRCSHVDKLSAFMTYNHIIFEFSNPIAHHSQKKQAKNFIHLSIFWSSSLNTIHFFWNSVRILSHSFLLLLFSITISYFLFLIFFKLVLSSRANL